MKLTHRIRCFLASGLLLLFAMQSGLGLWLHTIYHQPASAPFEQGEKKTGQAVLPHTTATSCSCVDDFLVPFVAVSHPSLPQASYRFFIQPHAGYYAYLPHSLRIFRSLRAPPAFVS